MHMHMLCVCVCVSYSYVTVSVWGTMENIIHFEMMIVGLLHSVADYTTVKSFRVCGMFVE
jgi:hypothetical protein